MGEFATRTHEAALRGAARCARWSMKSAMGLLLLAGGAHAGELGQATSFRAPSFVTSTLTAPPGEKARCDQPDCVQRHLDGRATVRLAGEFGRFTGRVAHWSADSLSGFRPDPDWGGAAPPTPLGWDQIFQVDQRVSNTANGAVIGALTLGALGALIAATGEAYSASFMWFSGEQPDYGQAALTGGAIGALVGAALGAAIGSTSSHWVLVYERP